MMKDYYRLMRSRTPVRRACLAVALMISGTLLTPLVAAAQSAAGVPRTAWGDPDQGDTWDFRTITPLERPEQYGDREFLTAEEAAALEQGAVERDRAADEAPARIATAGEHVGGYNNFWMDHGTAVVDDRRTSLIVDPPNGRRPPRTGDRSTGPPHHVAWGIYLDHRGFVCDGAPGVAGRSQSLRSMHRDGGVADLPDGVQQLRPGVSDA